jgi:plastocyanin
MKKTILSTILLANLLLAKDHIIIQKGKTFIPHDIVVKVGDTLTFKNSDPFAHNAYTDDEVNEFDTGMQKPGEDVTISIKKGSNRFNIECAIHPNMLLEVIVK